MPRTILLELNDLYESSQRIFFDRFSYFTYEKTGG